MKNINLIIVLSLAFLLSACETPINIGCISPEGSTEIQVVDFADFDEIEIRVDADVFITEGPVHNVELEAAPNILDRLLEDSRVRNDELILEINGCSKIKDGELVVRITMPAVTKLSILGDGAFETVGIFDNVTDLGLDITGDGDMILALGDLNMLSVNITGDGDLDCSGSAEVIDIVVTGDGKIDFMDLPAGDVKVKISGDGDCKLNATEEIQIDITGDGDIEAIGTVATQDIKTSGDGQVKNFELLSVITNVDLSGDGDIEISVSDELNIEMSGDGKVCYKGSPEIDLDISGSGKVTSCN